MHGGKAQHASSDTAISVQAYTKSLKNPFRSQFWTHLTGFLRGDPAHSVLIPDGPD
jgi:hypothetical protein